MGHPAGPPSPLSGAVLLEEYIAMMKQKASPLACPCGPCRVRRSSKVWLGDHEDLSFLPLSLLLPVYRPLTGVANGAGLAVDMLILARCFSV